MLIIFTTGHSPEIPNWRFYSMVMALLDGCWYPIELFPEVVRNIVKILPTTWAMQGMLDILLRGQGVAGILPEAGVLLGFAAVFFTIGVR